MIHPIKSIRKRRELQEQQRTEEIQESIRSMFGRHTIDAMPHLLSELVLEESVRSEIGTTITHDQYPAELFKRRV